jgi:membrane protease YdiL (CAAX protease family)
MHNKPIAIQFVGFFLIALISAILFKQAGTVLADFLFGTSIFQFGVPNDFENQQVIDSLKVIQLFTAIGFFIFPPLIFTMFFKKEGWAYLGTSNASSFVNYPITIFIMLGALPIINFLVGVNEALVLPESLKEIERILMEAEKQAEQIIEAFLKVDNLSGLVFNIVLIALIPAIGEELFFRGIVQKLMIEWVKKPWLAILITGIFFSALHFQFYGFLPRMMMGVLLGYLFFWTNSLWIPILAHFVNNATAVIMFYYINNGTIEKSVEEIGKNQQELPFVISSLGLLVFLLLFLYKNRVVSSSATHNKV